MHCCVSKPSIERLVPKSAFRTRIQAQEVQNKIETLKFRYCRNNHSRWSIIMKFVYVYVDPSKINKVPTGTRLLIFLCTSMLYYFGYRYVVKKQFVPF